MINKNDLLKISKKEYATTLRALKAFPEGKGDFQPHERSHTALKLGRTFVFEMFLLEMYLFGEAIDRSRFQTYQPENMKAVIADFEKESAHVLKKLEALPEAELDKEVEFAKTKFSADEFALMMIEDQIHHRGQLTVYIRMAGGKVPSIYGPSADDQATNL